MLTAPGPQSDAATGLQLVTPYPAVAVESGKSSTFNIEVRTPTPRRVNLDVIETPPGWQANLNGGGFTINGVFGAPDNPPSVQLNVQVPPGVPQGDYRVLVRGEAGGAIDILEVNLRVAQVVQGAVTLAAEFPTLRAASDATFNFKMTLTNNSPESTTFNLAAEGPEGWQITARPAAEEQATTVTVEGGASSEIQVEADPPENVTAAPYPIRVRADAGGSKTAETTVTAEVTGSFDISLTTPDERLNTEAVAGRAKEMQLVVKNDGTTAVTNVELTSSPPADWKVTFRPSRVRRIAPKRTAQVTAIITPSGDAVAGDYMVTMTASGEGTTENAEVRVAVKTSRLFGLLGILVIAAVGYVLFRVFGQYGRR